MGATVIQRRKRRQLLNEEAPFIKWRDVGDLLFKAQNVGKDLLINVQPPKNEAKDLLFMA